MPFQFGREGGCLDAGVNDQRAMAFPGKIRFWSYSGVNMGGSAARSPVFCRCVGPAEWTLASLVGTGIQSGAPIFVDAVVIGDMYHI
jgi:hypothetical protein